MIDVCKQLLPKDHLVNLRDKKKKKELITIYIPYPTINT